MVMLRSLAENNVEFVAHSYQRVFKLYFGPGGPFVGYIASQVSGADDDQVSATAKLPPSIASLLTATRPAPVNSPKS
jgi:hypothetical protein